MSKILLINGSPHEHGCTYTALKEVADTLAAGGGCFLQKRRRQCGFRSAEQIFYDFQYERSKLPVLEPGPWKSSGRRSERQRRSPDHAHSGAEHHLEPEKHGSGTGRGSRASRVRSERIYEFYSLTGYRFPKENCKLKQENCIKRTSRETK